MNNQMTEKLPRLFWVVAILALAWNLFGVWSFISQLTMSAETLESLGQDERAFYENIPLWVMTAFALAVSAGTLGSLALLFRKAFAVHLFALSLVGIIVQFSHMIFMTDAVKIMGFEVAFGAGLIFAVGVFMFLYSRRCAGKSYLR